MVRALIVDDSALMRQILSRILSEDPDIEVVGAAPDPLIARQMIKDLNPDVITLDIEMPRMDGLSFLERIMGLRPMPVVMVSSLTKKGADVTLAALDMGAVDFIAKPTIDLEHNWSAISAELTAKIKAAARARVGVRGGPPVAAKPASVQGLGFRATDKIVAIGASTGGVEALREVICALPADGPPVLIAQHMPTGFTARFAERLNGISAMSVSEAKHNARVLPGHVYIAPGHGHLKLSRSGAYYNCVISDEGLVSGHRPSVDVLFSSVALAAGKNAIGAILTGMGKDGAKGLLKMREAGAATLGQDEASCLIYGMPRAAQEIGAVQKELPLAKIASALLERAASTSGGGRPSTPRKDTKTAEKRV
ncbi:MAG: chemotaxis response regulator protein-glutamate methylesterase [Geminicoccaceae bacterium]